MHSLIYIHACNTPTLHDKDDITIAVPETYLDFRFIQKLGSESTDLFFFFFCPNQETYYNLDLELKGIIKSHI